LGSLRLVLRRLRRRLRLWWPLVVIWWTFWDLIDEITEGSELD